jgi:cell wall-associated NlpC family hydrolase
VPKHIPALATRAAFVATTTAAAALVALLPATTSATASAAPAPAPAPVSAPASVTLPVTPVALSVRVPTAAPVSAMTLALSKVGSPYRWGAAGPNAFDCSGLVTWAFKNAGISLPRTSRAMSQVGTPVSKADLRPGDLVFFYKPVSHVGIYIGNGKMVHASSRKSPVKVSDISGRTLTAARRL